MPRGGAPAQRSTFVHKRRYAAVHIFAFGSKFFLQKFKMCVARNQPELESEGAGPVPSEDTSQPKSGGVGDVEVQT